MAKQKKHHTVLVIDASGRGSALVHKYSQSPHIKQIIAIPGNDLMQINSQKPVKIFPSLKTTSVPDIIDICKKYKVDLVDVAQDDAVAAGLVDELVKHKFNVIGPTRLAGQIEWDKAWARDFMKKYKIPIPLYKICKSQKVGIDFIKKQKDRSWFVKAAGLALGKGAIPAKNRQEAVSAIRQMGNFGKAGETFVIEQWLEGEEFSMFAICDGKTFQIIGAAQDHKRLYDGDVGPNTGGVGCSTPPFIVNKNVYEQGKLIIKKTVEGLANEKRIYKGVLYLGAIVVGKKVFVIEFNARWGSPEAEVIVPGIQNDLFEIGINVAKSQLNKVKIKTDGRARVAITGSLRPGATNKKREMYGIKEVIRLPGITLYGTRITQSNNRYFVSSGRLFHVVGEGKNIIEARRKAYGAISMMSIEENTLHFRTDIGWRDVERFYDTQN